MFQRAPALAGTGVESQNESWRPAFLPPAAHAACVQPLLASLCCMHTRGAPNACCHCGAASRVPGPRTGAVLGSSLSPCLAPCWALPADLSVSDNVITFSAPVSSLL